MQYKALIKEPLIHFLALAVGLFLVFGVLQPAGDVASPRNITVQREDILRYMQYRAKAFDSARTEEMFARLSEAELAQLVKDYINEEVLYREAKSIGLDKSDYVGRLRLVQQFKFVTGGVVETGAEPSAEDVAAFFDEHKADYAEPAKITLAHVYFSHSRHGPEKADALARQALKELNANRAQFHQAVAYGDHFPYSVNYVQKEKEFVAGHFGREMADGLFQLTPDERTWRGPLRSSYGAHLVLITAHEDARTPALKDIYETVETDTRRALHDRFMERATDAIVAKYNIQLSDDLPISGRRAAQ